MKSPTGRAIHLNQKPLDLMQLIIEASTDADDVVWEPFGGLFTSSLAARLAGRRSYAAEIDATYFQYGVSRFTSMTGVPGPRSTTDHGQTRLF